MPTLDQPRARDLAAPQPGVPAGQPGVPAEVLTARAYLSAVAEPPAPALARLVAELGPTDAADLVARRAVPDSVAAESTRAAFHRNPVDLAQAVAEGIQLLTPAHFWPTTRRSST